MRIPQRRSLRTNTLHLPGRLPFDVVHVGLVRVETDEEWRRRSIWRASSHHPSGDGTQVASAQGIRAEDADFAAVTERF